MLDRIPFEPEFHPDPSRPGPSWLTDQEGLVFLRCECGLILGSLKNHSIDAEGFVRASVLHDSSIKGPRECSWHTFVVLKDWTDGAQGAGSQKYAPSKLK